MATPSEITSTEKLLNVIRKKKDEAEAVLVPVQATPKKTGRFKSHSSPPLISLQKAYTVGVDIGNEYLRVVRVSESGSGKFRILNRRRLALPLNTPKGSPEFAAFLKSTLGSICGSPKHSRLWVTMSTARVDVRHVHIPKVTKKQLDNVIYWTTKKEAPFDEREMIFDYKLQREVIEQGIPKLAAMVYTAPRQEAEELKNLFSRIGWPLKGISIAPFAILNLFRTEWISTPEGTIASLFIGTDFSRIDIHREGNLVMTRDIKAGLNSIVDALVDWFNEMKTNPDVPTLTAEQGRKILQSLSPDSPPLQETDAGYGLGKEAIVEKIGLALDRLARQVERTFEHYITTMPGEGVGRIFISGARNISQPIVDYMGAQLGIASSILDPIGSEESTVCPDVDDLHTISERIAFGPALGLALSNNERTPNLMFTCKDKERETRIKRINQTIFAIFIAIVLIGSATFSYESYLIGQKKAAIAELETQLSSLAPTVKRDQLATMSVNISKRRQLSKVIAERYLGMVLISELASLTPANIRFLDLKINLGEPVNKVETNPSKDKSTEGQKNRTEEVTVDGLILGERQMFETSIAGYMMALEASPLFRQVTIQKNSIEPYMNGESLHFILNMKVEEQAHG
jgi:Tfp pilus assembly PilM family ATPase